MKSISLVYNGIKPSYVMRFCRSIWTASQYKNKKRYGKTRYEYIFNFSSLLRHIWSTALCELYVKLNCIQILDFKHI